ncbi:hypothetical protein [Clostridium sp. BL-8]|uniref:hypothetical protein n=1 Tax=Clostridium sp. BL-8 TaxID=349938 RepID=UPI00098C06B4|nr:hypothetical protein [Clostridium sp. BL-8]OOM80474.1 hypothetical protein CLOBL_09540 [Clostridium sp. BL-8]
MSWKVTINYKLIDMYNNGFVFLSIKRNTGFILNGAIFHKYTWDEFNTKISITSFIDESCPNETAFEQGEQNIKESINIFNYLVDNNLIFEYTSHNIEKCTDTDSFINSIYIAESKNTKKIKAYNDILSNLSSEDKCIYQTCINYVNRGLQLYNINMYEEAFLCYYKGLELLANTYIKTNQVIINKKIEDECIDALMKITMSIYNEPFESTKHQQLVNQVKKIFQNGLDTKRKLKIFLPNYIELKDINMNNVIEEMVTTRNKMVAHGTILTNQEKLIDVNKKALSILYNMIHLYFFKELINKYKVKLNIIKNNQVLSIEANRKLQRF